MDSGRRTTIRTPGDLAREGLGNDPAITEVAARYALAITPHVLDRIDRADPADPVARQYVPDARELESTPEERVDPIGDDAHSPVKGIVHRYPDRALLKPAHACAVYCRFCFRREMVGPGGEALDAAELARALDYIRATPAIREVILTGGDPLVLSARRLGELVRDIAAIDHVDWMRIHTRIPVAEPSRVTDGLVAALKADKAVWVAVHVNHANELSKDALAACAKLVDAGIPLVGQTVLLKGVNDDAATLDALFRALVKNRIKPYYLHHGDLAPGTSHFRTTLAQGQSLMRELRATLSGLAQPVYVLDIPGGAGKVPVGPNYLGEDGTVEDPRGRKHPYSR
ncbi:MAG: lysine-2,3-aminomutase-like protein [Alphaproteobacteria bacterium]|nr:lysine-2,3-aminomutase-like protein [Alphaproteobacteria bacterium]